MPQSDELKVLCTWREFNVSIVRTLPEEFVIDPTRRVIHIRRSWRIGRMIRALCQAMHLAASLDQQWACRHVGKGSFLATQAVRIGCEPWKVVGCMMLDPDPAKMRPFEIDRTKREIRVSSRFNFSFAAAGLVEAVNELWREKIGEKLEELDELVDQAA